MRLLPKFSIFSLVLLLAGIALTIASIRIGITCYWTDGDIGCGLVLTLQIVVSCIMSLFVLCSPTTRSRLVAISIWFIYVAGCTAAQEVRLGWLDEMRQESHRILDHVELIKVRTGEYPERLEGFSFSREWMCDYVKYHKVNETLVSVGFHFDEAISFYVYNDREEFFIDD